MIPLRDANPTTSVPIVTIGLIVLNSMAFVYELSLQDQIHAFVKDYGMIPRYVIFSPALPGGVWENAIVPMITSLFLHGGWLHLIGNMWFLWVFGDNVEDKIGPVRFLLFYLLCGIGASLAHVWSQPLSNIPTIGASGAISGVLGAYMVAFPHARILALFIIVVIIRIIEIPAFVFLLFWIGFQAISAQAPSDVYEGSGGVAWWAHIGGFLIGAGLIWLFKQRQGHRDLSRSPRVLDQ
jgi:membrane associated rhomboid family serine protease